MSGRGKPANKAQNQEERVLAQVAGAANRTAAAQITAGIIAAANRPHSIKEALEILQNVQFSIAPAPWNPVYKTWIKSRDHRLKRIYD